MAKKCLEKSPSRGSASQLYSSFVEMIPSFIKNYYTKRCQSDHHKHLKEEALNNKNIAVLQIDFGENFTTM